MKRIAGRPERCLGCMQCEIACALANPGLEGLEPEKGRGLSRVKVEAGIPPKGRASVRSGGSVSKVYVVRCHQCEDPPCVTACMSGALTQGADGVVRVDKEHCVACRLCLMICPFGAIALDPRTRTAVKCELCPGREVPACVSACPAEALVMVETGPAGNRGGV